MAVVCIYSIYSLPTHLVQQDEKIIPVHHLSHQHHTQDNGSYNSWLQKGVLFIVTDIDILTESTNFSEH